MTILIPFQLLKLKKLLARERSQENLDALKNLITHDILGTIESNLRLGNITGDDAEKLRRLTHRLYAHLYSHYEEMEELNEMTDESLMLDIDIIEKKHEAELAAKDREIAARDRTISAKDKELADLKAQLAAFRAAGSPQ